MRAYIDAPNDDCYLIARWSILLGFLPSKLPVARTSCSFLVLLAKRGYEGGKDLDKMEDFGL